MVGIIASAEYSLQEILTLLRAQSEEGYADNGMVSIDYAHIQVHKGHMWTASYLNGNVADNAAINIVLTLGATAGHTAIEVACGGDADFEIYEAPTVTGGTPLALRNKNRYSGATAGVTAVLDATVNAAGTLLFNSMLPGGRAGQSGGGVVRAGTEWILHSETKYLFRLTNRSGQAKRASIAIDIYDH